MIPLRDLNVQRRRFPLITVIVIALNVAVFLYQLSLGPWLMHHFFAQFGVIPRLFLAETDPVAKWGSLLTSMFVHAGWFHIGGNMLYLWVFGDNVEDRMGRFNFGIFYLLTGAVAALTQILLAPQSGLPLVGASGAIAGVLGAYLRLFPRARVLALVPIFIFLQFVELPATFFLVFWFFIQLLNGTAALGASSLTGGPAFYAHIGGFVSGYVLAGLFVQRRAPVTWG